MAFVPKVFAQPQPIKSVEIFSEKLNYVEKEAGSWKVTKSAKWVAKDKAEITMKVDAISDAQNVNRDVLIVIDTSSSMVEEKLKEVRQSMTNLINDILKDNKNRVGLITFSTTSNIVTGFTNDKDLLLNGIDSLTAAGTTNYYAALKNVDDVFNDYVRDDKRESMVLFFTDGYPNVDSPNQDLQYSYLKEKYPYVTFNGVQYAMGNEVFPSLKNISDNQYVAFLGTLEDTLLTATSVTVKYKYFEVTDYIDDNNFYVENENDIVVNIGKISFDKTNQKIVWKMDDEYESNFSAKMVINATLKSEYVNKSGVYTTNTKEEVKSDIYEVNENVESFETPALANEFSVKYENNAPNDCNVTNVPVEEKHFVFDTILLEEEKPVCDGYNFKGWSVVTNDVKRVNDDYFIMPEEDVTIRAEWSKLSINKSMEGEVVGMQTPIIQSVSLGYNEKLWKYKSDITKVVIQNEIRLPANTMERWDISAAGNNSVIGYIVPNADNLNEYTAYIQGDGTILANSESSSLFRDFTKLEYIEGLENFDTSPATSMWGMFAGCSSLKTLNLSTFKTPNLTDMSSMFHSASSLVELDLSSFDTSNVAYMGQVFNSCSSLKKLVLTSFNTEKVLWMDYMFNKCSELEDLDLSSFVTSSVVDMSYLFSECYKLTSLNISNFDTSNVNNMWSMFANCWALGELDLRHFNTSKVQNMNSMFYNCKSLQSINLSSFNTENVNNMSNMFYQCEKLDTIDLSNFNTENVTSMSSMFSYCGKLSTVNLSSFNTENVTNMASMFYCCENLNTINLSSFNTAKVVDMSSMFWACTSLVNLNISSFNTANVENMYGMFYICSSLPKLDLSHFVSNKVTNTNNMFRGNWALTDLNISNFDLSNVLDTGSMFTDCPELQTIGVDEINLTKTANTSLMFFNCGKLNLDINVYTNDIGDYSQMFNYAAVSEGSQFRVNYTAENSELVDNMVATKADWSNVVKGELLTN